jgi:hypothetical protein
MVAYQDSVRLVFGGQLPILLRIVRHVFRSVVIARELVGHLEGHISELCPK